MVLVAGATGSVGGKIVRELLARGEAVRALVRSPAAAGPLDTAGAEVVIGDLTDLASLVAACADVDEVITTASATNRSDDTVENVDMRGTQNLIDAAVTRGVRHLVFVSTITAAADSPVPAFRAKAAAEAHLRESGLGWTVLHANGFMDTWFPMLIERPIAAGEPVTLVGASARRHTFIAEADVAAFAIAALRHPAALNATITIAGPEALTFRDVVRAYETVLGRSIEVRSVPPGGPIPGLPEPVWGFAAALETFDSVIPMEETAKRYGVTLTTALAFVRASRLAAALPGAVS